MIPLLRALYVLLFPRFHLCSAWVPLFAVVHTWRTRLFNAYPPLTFVVTHLLFCRIRTPCSAVRSYTALHPGMVWVF